MPTRLTVARKADNLCAAESYVVQYDERLRSAVSADGSDAVGADSGSIDPGRWRQP